jgi:hypothetical protein
MDVQSLFVRSRFEFARTSFTQISDDLSEGSPEMVAHERVTLL